MSSSNSQASNSILDGYLILKDLNPGGENDVFLALHEASQKHVAIKVINRDKILDTEAASFILQRYDYLERTRDPNIIRYYDIFEKQDCICIVMEYAEGGDLYTALMRKTFSNETLKKLALQLAKALFCLHKNGFYHGHLQLSSVLLDKEDNVKLADFSYASKMNGKEISHPSYLINPYYTAPEAIGNSLYQGPEADCWALGVILHILCFGSRPFVSNEFDKLVAQVYKGNRVLPIINHEAQDLIYRLLEPFPSRRYTITDVLQHSWLNDGKNELTEIYITHIDIYELTLEVEEKLMPEEVPIVYTEHKFALDDKQQVKEDTTTSITYEVPYVPSSERKYIRKYIRTDVVSKEPHSCDVPLPVLKGYRFLAFLGKGSNGHVYLAIHLKSNCAVAVKKVNCNRLGTTANVSNMFLEYEILRRTEHAHIIRVYNMFHLMDDVYVIMEYASGGEFEKLVANNLLSKWEEKRIFRQLCTAVYCIHQQGYCHRDLTLSNIVLDEEGNAKLIDFGLVTKIGSTKISLDDACGTLYYIAPEVISGSCYRGPEVDCWSLGVILYRLCYGKFPFDGPNFPAVFLSIIKCSPVIPNCQHPAHDLIMGLLDPNETRYTLNDIFNDTWIDEDFDTPLRVEAMNLLQTAKILTENPLFCRAHNLPIDEVLKCSGQVGEKIPVWSYNETPSWMDEQETDLESQKYRNPDSEVNCDENSLSKSKKDEYCIRKHSGEYPNADSYNEMINCSTDPTDPKPLSFNSTSNSPNGTLCNLDELGHSENKLGALEKSGDLTTMNERFGSSGDQYNDLCFVNGNNEEEFLPKTAFIETDAENGTSALHIGPGFDNNNIKKSSESYIGKDKQDKEMKCDKAENLAAETKLFMSCNETCDEYSLLHVEVQMHEEIPFSTSNRWYQKCRQKEALEVEVVMPSSTKNEVEVEQDIDSFEFRDTESFWKEELPKKRIQFKPAENYVELLPSVSEEGKEPNCDNAATKNIGKEPALIFGAEVKEATIRSTADYEESRYHKESGSCDSSFGLGRNLDSD